jgi:hypothetical protein
MSRIIKTDKELDLEVAATFSVRRAADMTAKGRAAVAEWFRSKASELEDEGYSYAPRYVARYWCKVRKAAPKKAAARGRTK